MIHILRAGCLLGLVLSGVLAVHGQEQPAPVSSESLLPASTKAWISVPDWARMSANFNATGPGQLAQSQEMKAFADGLRQQIDDYLDQRNFRLGITIDDIRNLRSGEICFAGILPTSLDANGQIARGSHGIVLLVNVAGQEPKANELVKKVGVELVSRGAVEEPLDPVLGIPVQRYRIQLKNPALQKRTLLAVAEGWLVASDNETIFRDIVRRLKNPEQAQTLGRLSDDPAFQAVRRDCAVEGAVADLSWFVEPFGYIQLSQAIADEEIPVVKRNNDYATKLKNQGFDVFRAIGGNVAFNQLDHDLVHRTCVHAPVAENQTPEQARCLRLFGLENRQNSDLMPESFVPAGADSYFSLTWDLGATFDNLGPIIDEFQEGTFERLINGWKNDMGVNVEVLIKSIQNRVSMISATARPIDTGSERVAFAIPMSGKLDENLIAIKKIVGADGTWLDRNGHRILLIQKAEIDPELELELDDLKMLDDEVVDENAPGQEEEAVQFNLFEKRFVAVGHGHLLIANNEEFLLQLLLETPESKIASAGDFGAVRAALEKLTVPARVCAREFGRNDQIFEVNYEMLRQDRMVASQTALARVINHLFASRNADDPARKRIDGSTLPADYARVVAPHLGPSGWAMERTDRGWLLSGCVLKKKLTTGLVRKEEAESGSKHR